ncbi:MAG: GNAT family N-acetyltransferase [Fimbriimonadaceae bacterium]
MSYRVRLAEEADRKRFGHVRSMVYRGGAPVPDDENLVRSDSSGYVVEHNGEVVGACLSIDMTCNRREVVWRCSGIAAVGVLPEHRGTGSGLELMRGVVRETREAGFDFSALYPSKAGFYRKAGYEFAGVQYEISCPSALIPRVADPMPMRQIEPKRYDDLVACYEAFAGRFSGMNIRAPLQWEIQMGGDSPFAVYAAGDPVEAYVAVRHSPEFFVPQPIREFVWRTRRGYEAGLALFAGLSFNKSAVVWDEPSTSPFLSELLPTGVSVKINRMAMYRALDVPRALEKLRPSGSGEFVIGVSDPVVSENEGPWRVVWSGGEVAVTRSAQDPDLRTDIGALSQALLGEPSAEQLLVQERIRSASPLAAAALVALLPRSPTYCLDYY